MIRQLKSEKLATVEKRKGATITKSSAGEIDEIYSLRIILKGFSAFLTVKRLGKKEKDALRQFKKLFKGYTKKRKYSKWLATGIRFHSLFAQNGGNLTLYKMIDDLRSRVHRYQFLVTTNMDSMMRHTKEHGEIIDAARTRDPELTRKKMELPLKCVYNEWKGVSKIFH